MIHEWTPFITEMNGKMRQLRTAAPEVMKTFGEMAAAATAPKALDTKTKELIAIGISIAMRCDACIAYHVKAALKAGASEAEIAETLGMSIYMGAGPSAMYAAQAIEAFSQLAQPKPAE